MSRPQKEGMDYFPHDTDARNDMKLRKLRAVYGNDGYSTYFILLENIYKNKDYSIDISDAETRLILCEECKLSEENFMKIIEKCLDLNLFDKNLYKNSGILTGEAIKKRTEPIENKRISNKQRYQENRDISDAETTAETPQSKVKESKVNIVVDVEERTGKVFQFYQKNIGIITPFHSETIIQYLDEGFEPEMIIAVMQDAIGKDNPWPWIKKVLANSDKNNIRTVDQYVSKKVEREKINDKDKPKGSKNPKSSFSNFQNRTYDGNALEEKLLKKSRGELID